LRWQRAQVFLAALADLKPSASAISHAWRHAVLDERVLDEAQDLALAGVRSSMATPVFTYSYMFLYTVPVRNASRTHAGRGYQSRRLRAELTATKRHAGASPGRPRLSSHAAIR